MNIEQKIHQARGELALKNICLNFKKTFHKSVDDIFSVFEDEKFIKRICNDQIIIFRHIDFIKWYNLTENETAPNIFMKEIYLISNTENGIIIHYFEFKDTIYLKIDGLVKNIKDEKNTNILNNLNMIYEIRFGSKNSFQIIKKSQNAIYNTFEELFIKSLKYANIKSGLAADILKLYYEDKAFNNDFNFKYVVDDNDFKNFNSLFEFFSSKYNIVNDSRLKKIPLSKKTKKIKKKISQLSYIVTENEKGLIDM